MRFEPSDIVIIAIVAILIFGSSRIPEVARSLREAIREFRDAVSGKDKQPNSNDAKNDTNSQRD